jgi:hypothetical protein
MTVSVMRKLKRQRVREALETPPSELADAVERKRPGKRSIEEKKPPWPEFERHGSDGIG